MTRPWKEQLRKAHRKGTRRERSEKARVTTVAILNPKRGNTGKRLMNVPLTEENYTKAPRQSKLNYHINMKMYYLIRGESGDGANANFHREIEEEMLVSLNNGGKTFDMKGNDITEEENERMATRRAEIQAKQNAQRRKKG
tara:strand:+ start:73 stop:495 length:423 start_codon:yes stop_codon:yes gene_type:complete